MNATTKVIKAVGLKSVTDKISKEHLRDLVSTLDRTDDRQRLARLQLEELGFVWWITAGVFVPKFRYHAALLGVKVRGVLNAATGDTPVYCGDVPPFALDNIRQAVEIKIGRNPVVECFTIHSMKQMPVQLVYADPVVIGWLSGPCINLREDNTLYEIHNPDTIGVVVAIWDKEGEITAL